MTRRKTSLFVALAVTAALAGGGYWAYEHREPQFEMQPVTGYYRSLKVKDAQPVETEAVRGGVAAGLGYVENHTLPSGQFVYAVNLNPAVKVAPGYNMVRHAGAIYAIKLANAVVPDARAVEVMQRSTKFMRDCCFAEVDGRGKGMWEPTTLTFGKSPQTFKLGGVGLALVALASTESVHPGSTTVEEMQELARFGHQFMRWNGEFGPRWVPSQGGLQTSGDVLYYPGEMVLGWMALYEQHPSPELMQWSVEGLMALARDRAAEGKAPADHWSLLATADLIRLAERDKVEIPRGVLTDHAVQICHTILEDAYAPAEMPVMEGALVRRGDAVTTSARLEGLLAALTFLPPDHPIVPHIQAAAHRAMAFLLRAQVKEGPHAGGMPLSITTLPANAGGDLQKFNENATRIQIDHFQHSVSAMARYLALRNAGVL